MFPLSYTSYRELIKQIIKSFQGLNSCKSNKCINLSQVLLNANFQTVVIFSEGFQIKIVSPMSFINIYDSLVCF